jgi:hypothetical protein
LYTSCPSEDSSDTEIRKAFHEETVAYTEKQVTPHCGFILFGRTGTYKGYVRIVPHWFVSLDTMFEHLPLQESCFWSIEDIDGHFRIKQEHYDGDDLFEVRLITRDVFEWVGKEKKELFVEFLYRIAKEDSVFIPFLKSSTKRLDFAELLRAS